MFIRIILSMEASDLTAALNHLLLFFRHQTASSNHLLLFHVSFYLSTSVAGFLLLKFLPMRVQERPGDLDMFFMSASAATVSSMSTIDMERFSNCQLLVLALLMLLGGEVFVSILGLHFRNLMSKDVDSSIELSTMVAEKTELGSPETGSITFMSSMRLNSSKYLELVVFGYLLLFLVAGATLILTYMSMFPTARVVLEAKGIDIPTFSFFTAVSSFANCGFMPTNENMIVFKVCSGLLLLVAALVLCGNTMYPVCLRSAIWAVRRITKRKEFDSMLMMDRGGLGYDHLLPLRRTVMLAGTVGGLVAVQFVLFCCMEWRSEALEGMSPYRKVVAAMFMSVNSRHAGESVVDLSGVSQANLVLYMVMMYLPPYTTFFPIQSADSGLQSDDEEGKRKTRSIFKSLIFSQLSYLAIFVIIICITERRQLVNDPLNFNALNIAFEVFSAYSNVGYSVGYSCKRQLRPDVHCMDACYGFAGRWSSAGKFTLIVVMLYGKLKMFNKQGGNAWILS